ncbi:carboxylesterase [Aspergillus granulosus]|uniref:Carboxylesterase n=1 Tax=Aspergillus granulosus TaxID=176169 RepID=A0ABR4HJT7_9EURO
MSLNVQPAPVDPAILKARQEFLDKYEAQLVGSLQWNQCDSAADYRKMRREGLNGFPKPVLNPKARTVTIAARDGHRIELRIISPSQQQSKGVWLHFHAGGFVIGSNASYDPYLTTLSDRLGLTMVSVEYRLAPENSFPKPLHDCVDAALYALTQEGEQTLGAPLKILGGESAGGWLAVSTGLSLKRDYGLDVRSILDAIVTGYGIYDMTYTPSLLEHTRDIILSKEGMMAFVEAGFGHIPMAERKDPLVSPLYANLKGMPPALFLTGDIEPLVDDSVFMAARWCSAGNEAELCVVEGACHAFTIIRMGEVTDDGIDRIASFVNKKLKSAAVRLD